MDAVQAAMVFVLDESRRPLLDWAVVESIFSLPLRPARGCCPEQSMGREGLQPDHGRQGKGMEAGMNQSYAALDRV